MGVPDLDAALRYFWHPVCSLDELAAAAPHPLAVELLGTRLAVADVGTPGAPSLMAVADRCPHRSTRLSVGWVEEGALRCAYHGWRFACDGRCVEIPSLGPDRGVIPERAAVGAAEAEIAYGLVWVRLDAGATTRIPAHPAWVDPTMKVLGGRPYTWTTSAARRVENFVDLAHFPWVHDGTLGVRSEPVPPVPVVRREAGELRFEYEPPELDAADTALYGFSRYRMPVPLTVDIEFTLATGATRRLWMTASPVDHGHCRTYWSVARDDDLAGDDTGHLAFQDLVLAEDEPVVCDQDPPELPLDASELSVRTDRVSIEYRRWLRELADAAAGPDPAAAVAAVLASEKRARTGTPSESTSGVDGVDGVGPMSENGATMQVLLSGGHVLDPATGLDEPADVLVDDGHIVAIGRDLMTGTETGPTEVVDCAGSLVVPGLIDLHVHVYPGLGDFCLHPDRVGVRQGVPTVVDAGTSGSATFGLARKWIDDPDIRTRVLAFLDPCQIYFATKDFICHKLEIANDERNLDEAAAAATVAANDDVVIGMKVRACSTTDPEVSPFLDAAQRVAGPRPVMVHLGRFPHTPTIPTSALLRALRAGDVITHAFRGASGVLDDSGSVTAEFKDAIDRGVRLDVGHSGTDFRFATARRLFDQGYLPTTISTDLNVFNVDEPVVSLAQTMSKIWALGVPLVDVVSMTTVAPAGVIGRSDELGVLAPGRSADVSVLRIEEVDASLSDGFEVLDVGRRLVPVGCLRAGAWIAADAA